MFVADVFRQFEKDGKFVCFPGQTTQAVTGMFNLFRASQVLFPDEKILEDAKKFSYNYLKEKQSTNELLDKWIIAKDLPGEVYMKIFILYITLILRQVFIMTYIWSTGWIRIRCPMVCELTSTRNKILLGAIRRWRRRLDWENPIQVLIITTTYKSRYRTTLIYKTTTFAFCHGHISAIWRWLSKTTAGDNSTLSFFKTRECDGLFAFDRSGYTYAHKFSAQYWFVHATTRAFLIIT